MKTTRTLFPGAFLFACGSLGAAAHVWLGAVTATLLVLVLLPAFTALLTAAWLSRGDSSDLLRILALRCACAAAVIAPVLALPGALLGWVGFCLMLTFLTLCKVKPWLTGRGAT